MPPVARPEHPPGGRVQRGEQERGPVPDVVVCAPLDLGQGQRQDRLGAVDGMDLTLLVHRRDDRPPGRRQVQPDDVPDLLDKVRINRELERLGAADFEPNARSGGPRTGRSQRPPPSRGYSSGWYWRAWDEPRRLPCLNPTRPNTTAQGYPAGLPTQDSRAPIRMRSFRQFTLAL